MVRSPGLAPPSSAMASHAAAKACRPIGGRRRRRQGRAPPAAGPSHRTDRNCRRSPGAAHRRSGRAPSADRPRRSAGSARIASAPRVMLRPRSPSPALLSRSVRSGFGCLQRGGDGEQRRAQALGIGRPGRPGAGGAAEIARPRPCAPTSRLPAPGRRCRPAHRAAPGAHRRPSASTASIPAFRAPSGNCPIQARSTARPRSRSTAEGVARRRWPVPSPACRRARSPAARRAAPRAELEIGEDRLEQALDQGIGRQQSPRARRPARHGCRGRARSPSSPSANPGRPTAGTVQAPSATPMRAEIAGGRSREHALPRRGFGPAAAAAPAILWTSTVPAMPRRRSRGTVSRSATSSATTTISTGMPSARASSAARPKFSRSPV